MSKDSKKTIKSTNHDEKGNFCAGNNAGAGGRPKGSLNKVTKDKREWVSKLLDDRENEIEEALTTLFKTHPDKMLKHLLGLLEYTTPKLMRQEITGPNQGPIELYLISRLEDPEQSLAEDATKAPSNKDSVSEDNDNTDES